MATGRPTKYKRAYCVQLVEHLAAGFSFESFGGRVNAGRNTLYEWAKAHPDFQDAKKRGETQGQLFWEQKGLDGLSLGGRNFNSTVWIFTMKNRFGWRDKGEKEVVRETQGGLNMDQYKNMTNKEIADEAMKIALDMKRDIEDDF